MARARNGSRALVFGHSLFLFFFIIIIRGSRKCAKKLQVCYFRVYADPAHITSENIVIVRGPIARQPGILDCYLFREAESSALLELHWPVLILASRKESKCKVLLYTGAKVCVSYPQTLPRSTLSPPSVHYKLKLHWKTQKET